MSKFKKYSNYLMEIDDKFEQITLSDLRYYKRGNIYYPSITSVLNYYPKGKFFEDWLKKVGFSSEFELKRASDEGTVVHSLIEKYLKNEEVKYLDELNYPKYSVLVWQMFLRFVEWWETFEPELLETEIFLYSDELKVAGACDLVCKIKDEVWIVDFKTSNYPKKSWELQTSAYKMCYEEMSGIKVDKTGILWLKSTKRSYKKGKMQGKNWEMIEPNTSYEECLNIFRTVKKLYDLENPIINPEAKTFKIKVKRKH
jgi:CRISPR/Cas system-associated exonuclease Cas4 (RecB family)